jgi:hypothetical protein
LLALDKPLRFDLISSSEWEWEVEDVSVVKLTNQPPCWF